MVSDMEFSLDIISDCLFLFTTFGATETANLHFTFIYLVSCKWGNDY